MFLDLAKTANAAMGGRGVTVKLQDITFSELLHNSYIKLTEVVGVFILEKI